MDAAAEDPPFRLFATGMGIPCTKCGWVMPHEDDNWNTIMPELVADGWTLGPRGLVCPRCPGRGFDPSPEPFRITWRYLVHNLVAHPLLVLAPPLGEWLHDLTIPLGDPDE